MNKYAETNFRIRDKEVRVLDSDGSQLGVMSAKEANALADKKNLDLVKISPNANPPVCKIMDYGKYKFEQSKRDKEAKKAQAVTELKEVWLSMTIEEHDLETKAKHARKFLVAGNKVKVLIRMRGRQQAHARLGVEVMANFYAVVEDVSLQDKLPTTEGRSIVMILTPKKQTATDVKPGTAAKPQDVKSDAKASVVEVRGAKPQEPATNNAIADAMQKAVKSEKPVAKASDKPPQQPKATPKK